MTSGERYNRSIMGRFLKRFLLMLATLGAGALTYKLMRAEGERALASARRTGGRLPPLEPSSAPRKSGPDPERARASAAPATDARAFEAAQAERCAGRTKSGSRCSREAQPDSRYCWQHA